MTWVSPWCLSQRRLPEATESNQGKRLSNAFWDMQRISKMYLVLVAAYVRFGWADGGFGIPIVAYLHPKTLQRFWFERLSHVWRWQLRFWKPLRGITIFLKFLFVSRILLKEPEHNTRAWLPRQHRLLPAKRLPELERQRAPASWCWAKMTFLSFPAASCQWSYGWEL